MYVVKSSSKADLQYNVDISLGVCECPAGSQGKPCKHQAATIQKYQLHAVNMVPMASMFGRQHFAVLALGKRNTQPFAFYASLHQQDVEKEAMENLSTANTGQVQDSKSTSTCHNHDAADINIDDNNDDDVETTDDDCLDACNLQGHTMSLESQLKDVFDHDH